MKNRAKAMIDHLPFLHSQTHFYSFHSCDSVILVFVFLRFRYISLFILECSKFNRSLYDYFVVTRAEIWSKFIGSPFLISYKDIVIKRINSHKKNQYVCTGFFCVRYSSKIRCKQKYVIMVAAHKNLPLR